MKCNSCGIEVSSDFSYAIKINKCPACGQDILSAKDSILNLLGHLFDNEGAVKIACLIMDNFSFEISCVDNNTKLTVLERKMKNAVKEKENENEGPVVTEDGIRLEKFDKNASKDILQKMRDEVLNNAVEDRYGIGMGDGGIVLADPQGRAEASIAIKQEKARMAVLEGSGGKFAFRRSE
jgi:hypothetical protein